jgi:hypothetical protein
MCSRLSALLLLLTFANPAQADGCKLIAWINAVG